VKADQHKAKRALQRGAALADPEALKNLAVMFRQGLGGQADQGAALKWYLAARAVRKAEDEAKAWLAENKASLGPEAPDPQAGGR
jgi:TPR repeat protein